MNTTQHDATLNSVMARLEELEQEHAALRHENACLQDKVAVLEERTSAEVLLPSPRPPAAESSGRTSRRRMLRSALGAAAATVGAGVLLETHAGTAAAAPAFSTPVVLKQRRPIRPTAPDGVCRATIL